MRDHFLVRHLERLPLGTPYPKVVSRVEALTFRVVKKTGEWPLLYVDSTGVGQPVVDHLRDRQIGMVVAVYFTGGEARRESWDGEHLRVALGKGYLVSRLQALPAVEALPTLSEVRYIQSRDEFSEKHISEAQVKRLYDSVLYRTTLRTIHEIFEADVVEALQAVVFNGIVTSIDRSTGHETTACILSVQAKREEFLPINLANVDPKACFKSLKGVGSSKLHSLTPVAPIVQMSREDSRFVAARGVADGLDDSVNLAAMDWEDFEHLIRELFEQEFATGGGEVKVTRASRDGGVDAIAFDPDPIRGGKIVIQAKRYTNTVGVAAVRDLYGTVVNEGANRGILVTTSDYGPDAYSFAKDKPIALLSGANLLHLLEKHGRRAKIDIAEARRLLH